MPSCRRPVCKLGQLLLCGSVAWSGLGIGSAWSVTLPEAISSALQISPLLITAEKQKEITVQQRRQALAAFFPSMDFSSSLGNERTNSPSTRAAGLGTSSLAHRESRTAITQTVFDGFGTSSNFKKAEAVQKAAEWGYMTTMHTVTMDAIERFLEVQKQRELLTRIQQFAAVQADFLNKIQEWYEGGAGTVAEVWQTESRLALTHSSLASVESQNASAADEFSRVFGFAPEQLDPVPSVSKHIPRTLEQALETARQNHPSLLEAQYNLEAAQAALSNAQSGLWPSLQLSLENTRSNNSGGFAGETESTAAMLRFNYNFFRGGGDIARSQEFSRRLEQAQAQNDQVRQAVQKNVEKSWRTLQESRQRLTSLQQHEAVSSQVTAAYHEQFLADQRSLLDVLNAENELFTAQNNRINAYYGVLEEEYRLLVNMGTLQLPPQVASNRPPPPPVQAVRAEQKLTLHTPQPPLRLTELTTQEEVILYAQPEPQAVAVQQLPKGTPLRILQSRHAWLLVQDDSGRQGWLRGAAAEEQPLQSGMFILPAEAEPARNRTQQPSTTIPAEEIPDLLPPE
ncbi:MAG: TolC family outer membrane protein [Magnetococcales bacterium]|nr:TolC family outer membrane protein [Magnetococcales bacterium]